MDNIRPPGKFEKVLPGVLTGLGIASFISAIFASIRATPKAFELMEQAEAEKGDILDSTERLGVSAKAYIPTMIFAATGATCIIASDVMQYKNANALLTLATTAGQAVNECKALISRQNDEMESYKKAMVDKFGEEAEKLIQVESAKYNDIPQPSMLMMRRNFDPEDELFVDAYTGQSFYATETKIQDWVNELNSRKFGGEEVTLNYWCDLIGINKLQIGNYIYWPADNSRKIEVMIDWDDYHQYKKVVFTHDSRPRVDRQ